MEGDLNFDVRPGEMKMRSLNRCGIPGRVDCILNSNYRLF